MRVFLAGLCALLSIACVGMDPTGEQRRQALTPDGGTSAAPDPDGGPEPDRCDWIRHWGTDVYQDTPCHWRIRSRDTAVALLVAESPEESGTCLAAATICGAPACSDLAEVLNYEIIAIWGPPDIDPEIVWSATESFACE